MISAFNRTMIVLSLQSSNKTDRRDLLSASVSHKSPFPQTITTQRNISAHGGHMEVFTALLSKDKSTWDRQ